MGPRSQNLFRGLVSAFSQRLNIVMTADTEGVTNRRKHKLLGAAVWAVAISAAIENNRMGMLIGEQ